MLVLVYAFFNLIIGDFLLKRKGDCAKAIIYKETFGGKTKPSLGYRFFHDGKNYNGLVVQDGVLKIGDSICVIYLDAFPRVNRPVTYFDAGEIKCGCR
jgi:hypothetical protein